MTVRVSIFGGTGGGGGGGVESVDNVFPIAGNVPLKLSDVLGFNPGAFPGSSNTNNGYPTIGANLGQVLVPNSNILWNSLMNSILMDDANDNPQLQLWNTNLTPDLVTLVGADSQGGFQVTDVLSGGVIMYGLGGSYVAIGQQSLGTTNTYLALAEQLGQTGLFSNADTFMYIDSGFATGQIEEIFGNGQNRLRIINNGSTKIAAAISVNAHEYFSADEASHIFQTGDPGSVWTNAAQMYIDDFQMQFGDAVSFLNYGLGSPDHLWGLNTAIPDGSFHIKNIDTYRLGFNFVGPGLNDATDIGSIRTNTFDATVIVTITGTQFSYTTPTGTGILDVGDVLDNGAGTTATVYGFSSSDALVNYNTGTFFSTGDSLTVTAGPDTGNTTSIVAITNDLYSWQESGGAIAAGLEVSTSPQTIGDDNTLMITWGQVDTHTFGNTWTYTIVFNPLLITEDSAGIKVLSENNDGSLTIRGPVVQPKIRRLIYGKHYVLKPGDNDLQVDSGTGTCTIDISASNIKIGAEFMARDLVGGSNTIEFDAGSMIIVSPAGPSSTLSVSLAYGAYIIKKTGANRFQLISPMTALNNSPQIVAHNTLKAQTATAGLVSYTTGAAEATYEIGGFLNAVSVGSTDTVVLEAGYTDENGSTHLVQLTPILIAPGVTQSPPVVVRARGGTAIVIIGAVTGPNPISYDMTGYVTRLYS